MRNAQQRGALCAHGELRNCLYQRQFRARRRHISLVPPRGWRSEAATEGLTCYQFAAKGVTALCLLRPNLPLTRLSEKGECAVRYYVSPDGTAQRKNGGQARSAAPDGFPQITKIFRPFGRKFL